MVFNVYELKNQTEIVRYYHITAGFPNKATWLQVIKKGFFITWPGLTYNAIQKYFPELEETQKVHMRKIKAGI